MIGEGRIGALGADLQDAGGFDRVEILAGFSGGEGGNLHQSGGEQRGEELHRDFPSSLWSGPSSGLSGQSHKRLAI
ncbi:hypothetical protein D9M72_534270 [compost metagenome]